MGWIVREEWRRKIKLWARKYEETLILCRLIYKYFTHIKVLSATSSIHDYKSTLFASPFFVALPFIRYTKIGFKYKG